MSSLNIKDTLRIKASVACDVCETGNATEYVPTYPPIMGADTLHATCDECRKIGAVPNYVCESIIDHVLQSEQRLVIANVSTLQTFANGKYVDFDAFTVWHITKMTAGEQSFIDSVRERVRFTGSVN